MPQGLDYYFLRVTPAVQNAEVVVDGRLVARTDADGEAILRGVGPGAHRIVIRRQGRLLGDQVVTFDHELNFIAFSLTQTAPRATTAAGSGDAASQPAAAASVRYIVDTNLAGATVFVDGEAVATTEFDGKAQVRLVTGRQHEILLSKRGYRSASRRVTPSSVDGRIQVILVPAPAPARETRRDAPLNPAPIVLGTLGGLVLLGGLGLGLVLYFRPRARSGPPAAPRPKTPMVFDRYKLAGQLGRGGVATIYRAVNSTDGSRVALKVLDSKWLTDPDMVQKFLSEAAAIQRIKEIAPLAPIVDLYRSGREGGRLDGLPFLALELLDGESVERRLERERGLPEIEVLGIGAQIAYALDGVHRAGIVHRDLTPDNVLLVPGEVVIGSRRLVGAPRVVLIDFGVARQEFLAHVTMDGSIAGKPPYMSPEQCRGEAVDHRSDLYALGLMLYTLVAGHPPFNGRDPFAVMRAQQNSQPPPLGERASVELQNLIVRLLAKDPSARTSSAESAAIALARLFEQRFATRMARAHRG